jgi:hypothetical protein
MLNNVWYMHEINHTPNRSKLETIKCGVFRISPQYPGYIEKWHANNIVRPYRDKMKKKIIERKISGTLLDFSMPLLEAIGNRASKQQIENVLRISYSVWNAVNFDSINSGTKYVTMLRQTMEKDLVGRGVIEELIKRKRNEFGDDLRLIGEYSLRMVKGEWRLRADVRDPSGIIL